MKCVDPLFLLPDLRVNFVSNVLDVVLGASPSARKTLRKMEAFNIIIIIIISDCDLRKLNKNIHEEECRSKIKAFDSTSHESIIHALLETKVPFWLVAAIMAEDESASMKVVIDGHEMGEIAL